MNLQNTTPEPAWDERNDVEIRRIDSASEIDHKAAEPLRICGARDAPGARSMSWPSTPPKYRKR